MSSYSRSRERQQNRRVIGAAIAGWAAVIGLGTLLHNAVEEREPTTNLEFAVTCPDGARPFFSDQSTFIDDLGAHAVRVSCFDGLDVTAPDSVTEIDTLFIPDSPESAYLEVTAVPCVDNQVFPQASCAAVLPAPAAGNIRQGVEDSIIPIYSAESIVDSRLVLQPEER